MLERIRRARRDESGFTLIELLIVIVILGILAAIVVFAVNGIQNRGAAAACKADVETVTVAAEAYDAQHGQYADTMDELVSAGLLHSVPSSSTYTIDYKADNGDNPNVSVSSSYCADAASNPSDSIGPGTDPGSDYCVEMAVSARQVPQHRHRHARRRDLRRSLGRVPDSPETLSSRRPGSKLEHVLRRLQEGVLHPQELRVDPRRPAESGERRGARGVHPGAGGPAAPRHRPAHEQRGVREAGTR